MGEQEAHVGNVLHGGVVAQAQIFLGVGDREGLALQDRLGAELEEAGAPGFVARFAIGGQAHTGAQDPAIGIGGVEKADDGDGGAGELAEEGSDVLTAPLQVASGIVALAAAGFEQFFQEGVVWGEAQTFPIPFSGL
jgi:hypothetical protein